MKALYCSILILGFAATGWAGSKKGGYDGDLGPTPSTPAGKVVNTKCEELGGVSRPNIDNSGYRTCVVDEARLYDYLVQKGRSVVANDSTQTCVKHGGKLILINRRKGTGYRCAIDPSEI
jgi:hypothetical protein